MSNGGSKKKGCPCDSGRPYAECCRPAHRRIAEPKTAEALMRSRFAAFALGEVDYLIDTISAGHEDRAVPVEALRQSLREVCRTCRFMALEVRAASEDHDTATVRFFARVFSKGQDRSFEETSSFVKEGDAWRYAAGDPVNEPAR